jgi:hypothetical protein
MGLTYYTVRVSENRTTINCLTSLDPVIYVIYLCTVLVTSLSEMETSLPDTSTDRLCNQVQVARVSQVNP